MRSRTSRTDPLRIASVATPGGGYIGMTFCPGKRDPAGMMEPWDRDLAVDLGVIAAWGAEALVTLMEAHELDLLRVPDIGARAEALGMAWYHLPIRDVSIPDASFERAYQTVGGELRRRLEEGGRIVIHCRGGLGRTGMVAARLLIELGEEPTRALERVRMARPGAVESSEQERYVLRMRSQDRRGAASP